MALTVNLGAGIEGAALCDELIRIQHSVKNSKNPAPKYFKFNEEIQHGRHACKYVGFLRVLLTMPVSVTSGERSFPRLKS